MSPADVAGRVGSQVRLTWERCSVEQRVAVVGALILVFSCMGPASFVEAALVLVAGAVVALVKLRTDGRALSLPFSDGMLLTAAGFWAVALIAVRILERPVGLTLLALIGAGLLVAAGTMAQPRGAHPAADSIDSSNAPNQER